MASQAHLPGCCQLLQLWCLEPGPLPSLNGEPGPLPSRNGEPGPLPSLNGEPGSLPSLNGEPGPLPSLNGEPGQSEWRARPTYQCNFSAFAVLVLLQDWRLLLQHKCFCYISAFVTLVLLQH